jgi:hypothetical protein
LNRVCVAGGIEYAVMTTPTGAEELPAQYTGCHYHDGEELCVSPVVKFEWVSFVLVTADCYKGSVWTRLAKTSR